MTEGETRWVGWADAWLAGWRAAGWMDGFASGWVKRRVGDVSRGRIDGSVREG